MRRPLTAPPAGASLVGATLRERRRALGITQAALAARAGISASYLNLIESGKRSIGGALLKRIANALGLALSEIDGAAERRLMADLAELCGEPLLADLRLEPGSAHVLAGRHREWARALARLHSAWVDRGQAVNALSDRLHQDPFLSDAVHSLLTQVTAIRSSAEILQAGDGLDAARRARFVAIVNHESTRLTEVARSLAAFFDKDAAGTRSVTPAEEVDDFLFDRDNYFEELERAAAQFRASAIGGDAGDCSEAALTDYLQREHGVQVAVRPVAELVPGEVRYMVAFDAAERRLVLAEEAVPATRRFELARLATGLFMQGRPVDGILAQASQLGTDAARQRARRALGAYLAAAVLLPYEPFLEAAQRLRYDVDRLVQRFGASFEQVCHRLITLRRPGAAGLPFALMRVDAAGFTSKRFPLPRLALPRHGPACPMWAVYQAFHVPGTIVRQLAAFPDGQRLLFVARTVEKSRPAFSLPRRLQSIMLACDVLHADQTVYGAGLDLSSSAPAVPVGPNCRLCVRRDCVYRAEDPVLAP
ncbi:MAG: short-chain fatty acyl-CoA regulator family protein [Burkholderiaceae bacterium]